ncbi:MAG: arsenate reductase ArsC [Planctomycetota bacterium]
MTTRILFLCTGNSARSILAEVIANHRFGDALQAWSAGSQPKGTPHPLALETLDRHGLPTDAARSESWDMYRDAPFDLVVTLCDSAAAETCPVFPGAPIQVHWGLPDPPAADDPAAMFEQVFRTLVGALERFTTMEADLDVRAAAVADLVST